jgi:hypothetical protein
VGLDRPRGLARLRQVRAALTDERGTYLDDDQLITAMCDAVLDRAATHPRAAEPTGRAKFQIAVSVCPRCDRGRQEGAGATVPIDSAAVERARCDAQHLGSIDGDTLERATQDIPPSIVRFVWRRDGGRCQTPGCRSSSGRGTHDPANLRLQCSSCHLAIHRRKLTITRSASGQLVAHRPGAPRPDRRAGGHPGADPKLDATILRTQARDALVGLGWKPAIARAAVDKAWFHVGPAVTIAVLIREALRCCHRPDG